MADYVEAENMQRKNKVCYGDSEIVINMYMFVSVDVGAHVRGHGESGLHLHVASAVT